LQAGRKGKGQSALTVNNNEHAKSYKKTIIKCTFWPRKSLGLSEKTFFDTIKK